MKFKLALIGDGQIIETVELDADYTSFFRHASHILAGDETREDLLNQINTIEDSLS